MTIETASKLQTIQQEALQTGDFTELQKFFQTKEYKELPYSIRNAGFVSSHKLKDFMTCQYCYDLKYNQGVPDPTESSDDTNEAFLVGQALDDILTEGEGYWKDKYEVVSRRSSKAEKVQLTERMGRLIEQMNHEFKCNETFSQQPKKYINFLKYKNLILKVELDDFDPANPIIRDIKTTANIAAFNPANYLHQMAFYAFVLERILGIKPAALLEVVDKNDAFSRSASFVFTYEKLQAYYETITNALDSLSSAQELGFFVPATDQLVLWSCPYYGYQGHGRLTNPILVQ